MDIKKGLFVFLATVLLLTSLGSPAFAYEQNEEVVLLPIVMYHSTHVKNPSKYSITPVTLEEDLLYIKSLGYTTIVVEDLIAYKKGEKSLPDKPIMLTFDDGYYNNYLYAFPLLKKHNMRAVFSIIGILTDKNYDANGNLDPTHSHLDYQKIKELHDSGFVEIQNHTYDLHSYGGKRCGLQRANGESIEEYRRILTNDLTKLDGLLMEKVGIKPTAVTYPYGLYNKETVAIIKDLGYQSSFSCSEGVNKLVRGSSLYNLRRYNRPSGISSYNFFKKLGVF